MHSILVAGAATAGVLVAMAVLLFRSRHDRRPAVVEPPTPRVAFRVLRTEEELGEALRRAAWSERAAADACRSRAERYDAMLRPLGQRTPAADEGDQPLSA